MLTPLNPHRVLSLHGLIPNLQMGLRVRSSKQLAHAPTTSIGSVCQSAVARKAWILPRKQQPLDHISLSAQGCYEFHPWA